MALYGWNNCPVTVRAQVEALVAMLSGCLAEQLIGIYLHGSLAMGCFNPNHSDLDLLVITAERLPLALRRQIIVYLLEHSQRPRPIEISFLAQTQLRPWRYPTPYDLHYSEAWRGTFMRELASGTWRGWNDQEHRDPDLAAHVTIINRRGICLAGVGIMKLFPAVPADDYRASLGGDIQDSLASIADNPVYTILNCCRTYAYVRDGHVFSKEEGGCWALQTLPAGLQPTVAAGLAAYCSDTGEQNFNPGALNAFAAYMRQVLAPILL